MTKWKVRKANKQDLPHLQAIYDLGRSFQLQTGNLQQWEAGYPGQAQIERDYQAGHLYVLEVEESETLLAVMALIPGKDPCYDQIEGSWLNEDEYVTIHRIASNGLVRGAGRYLLKWAQDRYPNIKIDTHQDNGPMIHLLNKLSFVECGIIYLENGDPRKAFQYYKR
ncbi:N-acetyltransferase [Facklamia sp. DSM 111018]|uniref:N-acetyltransferase n=1 Tax=Facklamia lactis TaxID=2749967 RepID=A0ABS0LT47_9LACT|nr:N-acetyltransferase [Facklamia lactis]MBG9980620.1 N-acetyltransferase [Facklamia lactis]MBG9986434.1 N-acetyltransferase [Facklamia lactis]